jgi:hypothetical protein
VIARCAVQRVDERVHHVGEHDLVAGAVQDQPDEPAADVAGAEVDRDPAHCCPPRSRVRWVTVSSLTVTE